MLFKVKSLLLILLLFCFAYSELTKYQQSCKGLANFIRVKDASDFKIANMNELKYDEELEKAAKKQKHSCSKIFKEVIENEMYSTTSVSDVSHNPTATKVACIEYHCGGYKDKEKVYVIDKGSEGRIEGKPGSKCPPGRSATENDLCEVSPEVTTSIEIGLSENIGIGVSRNIVMVVLVVVLNFI